MKAAVRISMALVMASLAAPAMADGEWWRPDQVENRIDRRESVIDRQTYTGRGDVVEDFYDAAESVADRRDGVVLPRFDRHERRSTRRIIVAD